MMSIEYILSERKRAARESREQGTLPRVITCGMAVRDIPFIGDRRPRGWKLVERTELGVPEGVGTWKVWQGLAQAPFLEVDSSGWGAASEGALTLDEFERVVEANPGYGWAIVESGQFQVVVGCFRPPKNFQH